MDVTNELSSGGRISVSDISAERLTEQVRRVREQSRLAVESARARSAERERQARRTEIQTERSIAALRRAGYLRNR